MSFDNNTVNLNDWTAAYTFKLKKNDQEQINSHSFILADKDGVNPFNQLIFSWNAVRPPKGYFSFYAQVKDAATQKWGVWHHMYDWGAGGVCSSYKGASDGSSSYEYVRLEMINNKLADAFRIKVQLKGGALLTDIKLVSVAASCYDLFKPENPLTLAVLPSVQISNVPKIAQFALAHKDKERICSPVSVAMLLASLGYSPLVLDDVINRSYDLGLQAYGSWPFNIAQAFESAQGATYFNVRRANSFVEVYQQLQKGIPVVVSVRGPLPGAQLPYAHGHLLLIVGWDNQKKAVICHDPAFDDPEKTLKYYPIKEFLLAWERSRRLSYWAFTN